MRMIHNKYNYLQVVLSSHSVVLLHQFFFICHQINHNVTVTQPRWSLTKCSLFFLNYPWCVMPIILNIKIENTWCRFTHLPLPHSNFTTKYIIFYHLHALYVSISFPLPFCYCVLSTTFFIHFYYLYLLDT